VEEDAAETGNLGLENDLRGIEIELLAGQHSLIDYRC
jgi:hypothetical protein